jgi:hypothetical protein
VTAEQASQYNSQIAEQKEQRRREQEELREAKRRAEQERREAAHQREEERKAEITREKEEKREAARQKEEDRKAEIARKNQEAETARQATIDAKKQVEEARRLAAEADVKRKADETAKKAAEAEAKRKADVEAKRSEDALLKSLQAENERRRAAEADAKRKAELEAKQKADESNRQAAEVEAKRRADELAKKTADAEAKLKLEADAKLRVEEAKRIAAEADAKRKADDAARKVAAAEAARKAQEVAKQKAEETKRDAALADVKRKAEAEAKRQADAELGNKLRVIMNDTKESPAARTIAAIGLGQKPPSIGGSSSTAKRGINPSLYEPSPAERELAAIAIGRGRATTANPPASSNDQLLAIMNNPKETPASRQLAAIALGKDPSNLGLNLATFQPAAPLAPKTVTAPVQAAPSAIVPIAPAQSATTPTAQSGSPGYTFAPTAYGTVQISQDGKIVATTTPQFAAQNFGYQIPATSTTAAPAPAAAPIVSGNVTTPSGAVVNAATGQLVSLPPAQSSVPSATTPATNTTVPSAAKSAFTFSPTSSGTVQVFENGQRIATVTPALAAQQYGYKASTSPVPGTAGSITSEATVPATQSKSVSGTSAPVSSTPTTGPTTSTTSVASAVTPSPSKELPTVSATTTGQTAPIASFYTQTQMSGSTSSGVATITPNQTPALWTSLQTATKTNEAMLASGPGQIGLNILATAGGYAAGSIAPALEGKVSALGDLTVGAQAAVDLSQKNYLGAAQVLVDYGTVKVSGGLGAALMPENPVLGKAIGEGSAQFVITTWQVYGAPVAGGELVNLFPGTFIPPDKTP